MRRRSSALHVLVAALLALVVGAGGAMAQGTARRFAGTDRYGTMDALVREGFSSSEWAVVATADSFPDALAAAPVAGARRAPVILTSSSSLTPTSEALIRDLRVSHALIMGGEGAVSGAVEASLTSMGVECERVSGADRARTSVEAYAAARAAGSSSDTVIVATGTGFADALAMGPWAWRSASPVLLADGSGTLCAEAVAAVKADPSVRRVVLVGGPAVVSDEVKNQLGDAYTYLRLAGADRFQTAYEVARWSCSEGLSWSGVAVATGSGFADALSAASTLGLRGMPLLLASEAATSAVRDNRSSIDTLWVLGGDAAVSDAQQRALDDALAGREASGSANSSQSSYPSYSSYSSSSSYPSYGSSYGPGYYPYGYGYAGGTYVDPQPAQPQPQPQPEPSGPEEDGYAGPAEEEPDSLVYLWPDEEDVMISGAGETPSLLGASTDDSCDPIYAQAEEADMPVTRTSQTLYVEAPLNSEAPTLYRVGADGSEVPIGVMTRVSDSEVKWLNDEYAGNTAEDTGEEYIVLLDPKVESYWQLTLTSLPAAECSVTYLARANAVDSNKVEVEYWVPFTTQEISVMDQVDNAIIALTDNDSFWQQPQERRHALVLNLLNDLIAQDLIEEDSLEYDEDEGIFTFLYNQDANEGDDDGIMGLVETMPMSDYDEYSDFDETIPEDETLPTEEAVPDDGTDADLTAMSEPLVAQASLLSKKKALIVNGFPAFETKAKDRKNRTSFYRRLTTEWKRKGITTTLKETVTVDTYKKLNTYDIVVIATHGARYKYTTGSKNNRKRWEISAYCVREPKRNKYYAKLLKDRQIVRDSKGYWILPDFFRARYKRGGFRNVVVASESCSHFGCKGKTDTELPSVFTRKGATAAMGFRETLLAGYGRSFIRVFFNSMIDGEDVGTALGVAKNKVGKNQLVWWNRNFRQSYWKKHKYNAYPMYVGRKNGRLAFI